ncbi:30S ribosomal protein S7 [Desulfurispirillum indicum]|uniref:Small ribosomal subunit protein uS7 n=1 Tax=Desulfurispirillum indicum (strain ATCC BAA-1389 / DSM 22839 / S5) TaxID=653733 RepID=E6W707_DESIS|nr:30S ribosomal protein S7 [Desulfurispirillum indicum]ADU65085.1 ribosomal protein S7 [Desulfurispirillum indicum S5]UCZ56990.1 30S ribosomal protein S7 [Desulfurispirillum indicum]
MPRRRVPEKREVLPDPIYGSVLVSKFVNRLMRDGKKSVAESILYGALDKVKERFGDDEALNVFQQAVENVKPALEVKSRRVGGATYQVPVEVKPRRQETLSIRWIIAYAKKRKGKGMVEKLANEITDASKSSGEAVKKREDTHKMAEANKAFAHYRW